MRCSFPHPSATATALLYCAGFVVLGMHVASLGPVLLELAAQADATLQEAAAVFTARSVGYLVGSLGGGFFDRCPGHSVVAVALLVTGVATFSVPFCRNIWVVSALVSTQGMSMGILDAGVNVLLLWLFAKQDKQARSASKGEETVVPSSTWMQSLHFAFGVGAMLGPLVVRIVHSAEDYQGPSSAAQRRRNHQPPAYTWAFVLFSTLTVLLAITYFLWKAPAKRSREEEEEEEEVEGGEKEDGGGGERVGGGEGESGGQEGLEMVRLEEEKEEGDGSSGGGGGGGGGAVIVVGAGGKREGGVEGGKGSGSGRKGVEGGKGSGGVELGSGSGGLELESGGGGGLKVESGGGSGGLELENGGGGLVELESGGGSGSGLMVENGGGSGLIVENGGDSSFGLVEASGSNGSFLSSFSIFWEEWGVVLLAGASLGMYVGAETGYGSFLTAYMHLKFGYKEAVGQEMSSGFWGAVAAGRLASIWVARVWSPKKMLVVATGGLFVCSVLAVVAGYATYSGHEAASGVFWAISLLIGASMSCIFPATLSLADAYAPLQGKHTTAIVVGAALGEMAVPVSIAAAMTQDPTTFAPVVMAVVLLECIALAALILVGEKKRRQRGKETKRDGAQQERPAGDVSV